MHELKINGAMPRYYLFFAAAIYLGRPAVAL
jgi:hypothetical protein